MRKVLDRPVARAGLVAGAIVVIAMAALAAYIFRPSTTAKGTPSGAQPTLSAKNGTVFTIESSASTASFTINEILLGNPNTVVGKTSDVSGQIAVNQQQPSQSQVGTIRVNLTTLVTDNGLRNRSIQNYILETGASGNQYATFVTRSITGWPASVAIGQTVSLQLTGDLTLHGQTHTATFSAQVTLTDASTLTGQAQATITYTDYGISIPNVPSVTGVGNTVKLALSFTARA